VQQHVLDDRIGALAVLHDLIEIVAQSVSARVFASPFILCNVSCSSSIISTETPEKLLTKLSGFLISWAMPAVSWPSEASF
jgi:hypothetical protein